MPAYNAEKTFLRVLHSIPSNFTDLLLVDDVSRDKTVSLAESSGIRVVKHTKNQGYGGNQKTCYKEALNFRADIVVMLHPDLQYDPKFIPNLVEPILSGRAFAVFGSRMMEVGEASRGGMPLYKIFSNIILSKLANLLTGANFTEWHCGFRAYSRKCLEVVEFSQNSDGYDFDIEMTLKLLKEGIKIVEIPIPTRYDDDASSISFYGSVIYGLNFLKRIIQYRLGLYP